MAEKYFHELNRAEFDNLAAKNTTWSDVKKSYRQPKWCSYPDALNGVMGCWSLIRLMVENENYCKGCDCYEDK